jgi:hypothetical protein
MHVCICIMNVLCMYVCVYMCMCVNEYMYVSMCMYFVCTKVYEGACMCMYVCVCIYVCICVYVCRNYLAFKLHVCVWMHNTYSPSSCSYVSLNFISETTRFFLEKEYLKTCSRTFLQRFQCNKNIASFCTQSF